MRVMVTGAGGFVGSHVIEAVLEMTDWDIVAVDSFRGYQNGSVDKMLDAMGDVYGDHTGEVQLVPHDLTVPFSSRQRGKVGHVDYIMNVASLCQVGQSISDPVGFTQNNVNLMLTMLEFARIAKPLNFIHMSTDEVYGQDDSCGPADHQPSSPYAASKAAQEDISRSYRRTFGVPVTIVNSANMFGERQSQLAFIPKVVKWLENDAVIPVHTVHGKPGGRNYSYVKNVARYLVQGLLNRENNVKHGLSLDAEPPHRLHLGGQSFVANDVLVDKIAAIMGVSGKMHYVEATGDRPGYDAKYAQLTESTWTPQISFDTGLIDTVNGLMEE